MKGAEIRKGPANKYTRKGPRKASGEVKTKRRTKRQTRRWRTKPSHIITHKVNARSPFTAESYKRQPFALKLTA